jgi:hypothetical protein
MKRLLVALVLLLLATPALAAEGKKEEGGQNVTLSPVALPIVVDGRLVNYVFVTLRLDLAPLANTSKLREKEPYFRDAIVRAAHRTPFTLPGDLTRIDEVRLKAAMLREATAIAGPGQVRAVVVVSQAPKSTRVN